MDSRVEQMYVQLMMRDKDLIIRLQIENEQLKELLNKDKKPEKVNARKS